MPAPFRSAPPHACRSAQQSPLLTETQKNTQEMLDSMLTLLGFQHVTVTFGGVQAG